MHSFPWVTEFWAKLWNLPIATEFRLHGILWNDQQLMWSLIWWRSKCLGENKSSKITSIHFTCGCTYSFHFFVGRPTEAHEVSSGNARFQIFECRLKRWCTCIYHLLMAVHPAHSSLYVKNTIILCHGIFPQWATEFFKLSCRIWQNFPQKTVALVIIDT